MKVGPEGGLGVAPFSNGDSVFPSRFEWLESRKERDELKVSQGSKKVRLRPKSIGLWF